MTEKVRLKLVLAYDPVRNEYSIVAHNRTPAEADGFVGQWTPHLRPDRTFILLEQGKRHQTEEAQDCRACRDLVAHSAHLEPKPKFVRRKE